MSAKPDFDLQGMMEQFIGGMNSKAQALPGWWNSLHYQQTMTFEPHKLINFAKSALFAMCLTQGGTVLDTEVVLKLNATKVKDPAESVKEFAQSAGLRCVYINTYCRKTMAFLVTKTAAIQLSIDALTEVVVANIVTINPTELDELQDSIKEYYEQMAT